MVLRLRASAICLVVLCVVLISLGSSAAKTLTTFADDGIRIDVPINSRIRVENQFGPVTVDVWQEKYVSVAATLEGSDRPFTRSPIVIENKTTGLSISVIRTPVDPSSSIELSVKMPSDAHAQIFTREGNIVIRGLAASASLRSMAGNVRAELQSPLNAQISATTTSGVIKSELAGPLSAGGHQFQTRLGTAESVLNIVSNKGTITLATSDPYSETPVASGPPKLVGSEVPVKSAGTPANESPTEDVSEGDVIRVDSQLATLNMSVIDQKTNRGIVGLTQRDFQLFEDGMEQKILQFESASAPFDLLLLIDVSGSTRDVVKLIRSAALRFVAAARPSDRIAVISFAGQPKLVSPLTLDRDVLRQRIETIDTAAGDTKVYDAVEFALKQISPAKNSSRRSAVVLMSDGLDGSIPGVQGEGSTLSYAELLSSVREFDGVLYTLWLNTEYESVSPLDTQPEAFDMGHDRTLEMAEAGGGVFYEVERLEDLAGTYERVVADLGTVYSLAYRPTNKSRDGKWRAIRVTVDRPSAVARGKRGYYAN